MKNKVLNKISVACKLNADYLTVTITNKDTGSILQELIPLEFSKVDEMTNDENEELMSKSEQEINSDEELSDVKEKEENE